jgi:hypothetical protein
VAAGGLRWMLVGQPARLAKHPTLAGRLDVLLPGRRLDAFAATTGVDLRSTPGGLVAGFDFATLYMAETPGNDELVEKNFSDRLLRGANVKQPHPALRRLSGVVGMTPQTLVRVDGRFVAVSVGDPTPARVVEAFARRRLARSKPALMGSSLSSLPKVMESSPLRFYAPGPFEGEWLSGARGLLAAAVAFGATAEPRDPEALVLTLYLAGDFAGVPELEARAAAAWTDVAESSLGRLLGLNEPIAATVISATPEALILRVELRLQPIVQGLYAAVSADVWRMLDQPPAEGRPHESPGPIEKK